MKTFATCLLILLALSLATAQAKGTPIPPGMREAQKHAVPLEAPPQAAQRRTDPVQLQHEAQELAELANSIPPAIDQVNRGLLPKEIVDKLKRIEKLSRHLRGELAP